MRDRFFTTASRARFGQHRRRSRGACPGHAAVSHQLHSRGASLGQASVVQAAVLRSQPWPGLPARIDSNRGVHLPAEPPSIPQTNADFAVLKSVACQRRRRFQFCTKFNRPITGLIAPEVLQQCVESHGRRRHASSPHDAGDRRDVLMNMGFQTVRKMRGALRPALGVQEPSQALAGASVHVLRPIAMPTA